MQYARNHGNVASKSFDGVLKQVFQQVVQVGYWGYSPITELTRMVVGGVEKTRERVLTDNEIHLVCSADHHADLFCVTASIVNKNKLEGSTSWQQRRQEELEERLNVPPH